MTFWFGFLTIFTFASLVIGSGVGIFLTLATIPFWTIGLYGFTDTIAVFDRSNDLITITRKAKVSKRVERYPLKFLIGSRVQFNKGYGYENSDQTALLLIFSKDMLDDPEYISMNEFKQKLDRKPIKGIKPWEVSVRNYSDATSVKKLKRFQSYIEAWIALIQPEDEASIDPKTKTIVLPIARDFDDLL